MKITRCFLLALTFVPGVLLASPLVGTLSFDATDFENYRGDVPPVARIVGSFIFTVPVDLPVVTSIGGQTVFVVPTAVTGTLGELQFTIENSAIRISVDELAAFGPESIYIIPNEPVDQVYFRSVSSGDPKDSLSDGIPGFEFRLRTTTKLIASVIYTSDVGAESAFVARTLNYDLSFVPLPGAPVLFLSGLAVVVVSKRPKANIHLTKCCS